MDSGTWFSQHGRAWRWAVGRNTQGDCREQIACGIEAIITVLISYILNPSFSFPALDLTIMESMMVRWFRSSLHLLDVMDVVSEADGGSVIAAGPSGADKGLGWRALLSWRMVKRTVPTTPRDVLGCGVYGCGHCARIRDTCPSYRCVSGRVLQ